MSTALVLADDGRRADGRWAQGAAKLTGSGQPSDWRQRLRDAGVILDHAPELAPAVVSGELALDAALKQAEASRDAGRLALPISGTIQTVPTRGGRR